MYVTWWRTGRRGWDLFDDVVVHLEGPQLQAGGQLRDGGEGEQEELCAAQGNLGVLLLGLLDPLRLLLRGDHGQEFLGERRRQSGGRGEKVFQPPSSQTAAAAPLG